MVARRRKQKEPKKAASSKPPRADKILEELPEDRDDVQSDVDDVAAITGASDERPLADRLTEATRLKPDDIPGYLERLNRLSQMAAKLREELSVLDSLEVASFFDDLDVSILKLKKELDAGQAVLKPQVENELREIEDLINTLMEGVRQEEAEMDWLNKWCAGIESGETRRTKLADPKSQEQWVRDRAEVLLANGVNKRNWGSIIERELKSRRKNKDEQVFSRRKIQRLYSATYKKAP